MGVFPKKTPTTTTSEPVKPPKPEVKKVEGPDGQAYWTENKGGKK
jgi:hypothetical protein